ncbi:GAF and ANTAR domain-containing protein [Streptomyces sp. NPDC001137]|uniref:GAF and ANTAR domain-containing protein n=1 Tax=Streptomyces sp. NPDC001137 TaxID=3154378 RepID=UPI003326276F
MNREQQLAEALVGLADSLADDVDPVVLLDRLVLHCLDLVGADAVGVMIAGLRGELRLMAVTDQRAALTEFFQLQTDEGPCVDCYRKSERIDAPDLGDSAHRWPHVAPYAREHGFRSAHALPMRVHHQTVGALNLLLTTPGGLPALDLHLAQALADVTTVALVNWSPHALRPTDVSSSVQRAVAAKATVDIATGMIAEHGGLSLPDARSALAAWATRNGRRLTDVAHGLVQRTEPLTDVLSDPP